MKLSIYHVANYKISTIVFLLLFLPSTTTLAEQKPERPTEPDFTPDPENAVVYIYRPHRYSAQQVNLDTYFNDEYLGAYQRQRYVRVKAKPGSNDVWVDVKAGGKSDEGGLKVLELFLQKNKVYFVSADIEYGMRFNAKLNRVSPSKGEQEINDIYTEWNKEVDILEEPEKVEDE